MADKKPALDLVIEADKSKSDDMGDSEPGTEESTEDYSSAASELLAAIKAGDESAFAESLKACIMSCK